jgi:hypothetical protein
LAPRRKVGYFKNLLEHADGLGAAARVVDRGGGAAHLGQALPPFQVIERSQITPNILSRKKRKKILSKKV